MAALDGAGRLARSDRACHRFDVAGAVRCAVTLWLVAILALLTLFAPTTQAAAPERRQAVENRAFFALQPIENQAAELQTHTADVDVTVRDGLLIASVDALYRLQNSENDAITVLARVVAQDETAAVNPEAVTVTLNGQPVTLLPAENDALTAQLPLPADGRGDVRLRYDVLLDAGPLVDLRYDATGVAAWPGARSIRVAFALPSAAPPASWLDIAPAGWSDVVGSDNAIKWLYDGLLPNQAMRILFIDPTTWARLQAAEGATSGGESAAYAEVGDLYRSLASAGGSGTSSRFFAQALAAYTAGVTAASNDPAAAAPLQRGLATLYRSRINGTDSRSDALNAALMAEAAAAAATGLPADSAEWTEMRRWQQEGLNVQLIAARERRDWAGALGLVEQMAALPDAFVDAEALAQQRRELEVQQALQLLGQGDRNAALALAGEGILDAQLTPPVAAQSLFASWQATMTTGVEGTEIAILAQPTDGMETAAQTAMAEQIARWQTVDLPRGIQIELDDTRRENGEPGRRGLRLTIVLSETDGEAAGTLVSLLGGGPHWALLRSLLQQTAAEVEQTGRLFWQETTLRQTLGLATAGDQWRAMAADLNREASQFEAQTAALINDPAAGEEALRAEIQAVNYRNAAQVWAELAESSWVVTTLKAPSALDSLSRSWMTTVDGPAQTFEYSTQSVNPTRVVLAAIIGLIILLLLTTLLWRLL